MPREGVPAAGERAVGVGARRAGKGAEDAQGAGGGMKFKTLTVENFLSFRKPQTVPLADQGLVLVRGDNRVSGAASSNGSGKTAIFDALCFALFGLTTRGLKADDVACRFTEGTCSVLLTYDVDGRRHSLCRKRRPAALEVW